ncbi:MAG: radical SAM protein, partial [Candidatus Methanomethylophilaceae archaeon]|nr:radical SAM protein [Candidatus Methanomethylophilaceae archaeon]
KCGWNCFYCPVSLEKKGLDVVYANEGRVTSDEEIIAEAESMDATGTGITGGDPLVCMDRTLHYIRLLKDRFGPSHHIHLYTATIDPDKALALQEAGLDEIRFHPRPEDWSHMEGSKLAETVSRLRIDVGIEVPALPGAEKELDALVAYAVKVGVKFVNLNELEFSESNWHMMDEHGFSVRDEVSAAVSGSAETALKVMRDNRKAPVHFCSSPFKDGVQLRRRLIRMAERSKTPYQQVTEDGTLLHGLIYAKDTEKAKKELLAHGVPEAMMAVGDGKIEVAPWILEKIYGDLSYECYLSERYPTKDGLEVERTPLRRD